LVHLSLPRDQREAIADGSDDDFADEHDEVSFADEPEGGPEKVQEPDSPEGHAGMD
jgi:hypothetical protein